MLATRRVAAAQNDDAEEAAVHEALRDVVADSLVGAGHHGDASGDHLSVGDLGLRAVVTDYSLAPCWYRAFTARQSAQLPVAWH